MANSTAGTIITYASNITKIDPSTIAAPGLQNAMLLAIIDNANQEWQAIWKTTGGEPQKVFQGEMGGATITDTTLSAAQAVVDVTASLTDSTSFPSSGAVVVYTDNMGDVEEFTGNTGNTLTGVTGIDFAHNLGDTVSATYALPSTFMDFRAVEGSGDGVIVNGVAYYYTSGVPLSLQFSVYDNGTTKYLLLPRGVSGNYQVYYNKATTHIDATTDTVDVPTVYEYFLVWRLVEHIHRVKGSDVSRSMEARQLGNAELLRAQMQLRTRKGPKMRSIQPRNRVIYTQTGVITV
jgi:hypothetical protein